MELQGEFSIEFELLAKNCYQNNPMEEYIHPFVLIYLM